MIPRHALISAILLIAFVVFATSVLADPPPPRIDWKEFIDQLGTDPKSEVGEHLC